ncbi:MAG: HIT domain-containing protein [Desulfuromonadales bacterium]|nr:HIT domain-containing protein [Desulfuromonadales bacterium]
MFELHPRLAEDTLAVGDFPLCRLLLMNDASYPWFILVPRRAEIREIFELARHDQQQLLDESSQLSQVLNKVFHADKLNIAALGNMVPQLHIHHIVRYQTDQAWPNPVWGLFPAQPYTERVRQETCAGLLDHLIDFIPDKNCIVAPGIC